MGRIYTKTGDEGMTGLFGGGRVAKDDERVEAYGEVDELNAALGLARSLGCGEELDPFLEQLQQQLFTVGAVLATPRASAAAEHIPQIRPEWIQRMETQMDALDQQLPALTQFVLPGGVPGASALHLARTICRRAERRVAPLQRTGYAPPEVLIFLNRLSDLLFMMARRCNQQKGKEDVRWVPSKEP
jgi:cob(I)alamin adenosyltransferase